MSRKSSYRLVQPPPAAEFGSLLERYRKLNDETRKGAAAPRDPAEPAPVPPGAWATVDGRPMLNLASYDYLGMFNHPHIVHAAAGALDRFGTAVHDDAGTSSIHRLLEIRLARYLQCDDAIVFNCDYVAHVATIASLIQSGDVVIGDELNHPGLVDGCRMSGAELQTFEHYDWQALESLLAAARGRQCLIAIDAVCTSTGEIADLPTLVGLSKVYGALLLVNEAHSLGTLGDTGQGIGEHFHIGSDMIDIRTGSLCHAIPSLGGFVAGNQDIVDFLRSHARGYLGNSPLPGASVQAALAGLDILESEPHRVRQLQRRCQQYVTGLRALGLEMFGSSPPIIPIATRNETNTLAFARHCREQGLQVAPMFAPDVPDNIPRVRTCVSAAHSEADIARVLEIIGTYAVGMTS